MRWNQLILEWGKIILSWPIIILILILVFKDQIKNLLSKIKIIKHKDTEVILSAIISQEINNLETWSILRNNPAYKGIGIEKNREVLDLFNPLTSEIQHAYLRVIHEQNKDESNKCEVEQWSNKILIEEIANKLCNKNVISRTDYLNIRELLRIRDLIITYSIKVNDNDIDVLKNRINMYVNLLKRVNSSLKVGNFPN